MGLDGELWPGTAKQIRSRCSDPKPTNISRPRSHERRRLRSQQGHTPKVQAEGEQAVQEQGAQGRTEGVSVGREGGREGWMVGERGREEGMEGEIPGNGDR